MTDLADDVSVLPTWDMAPWFPGLDSREVAAAHEGLQAGVDRLVALFDRHDVRAPGDGSTLAVDADAAAAVEEVLVATNALLDELNVLDAYVYAHVSTDARNDLASGLESQLRSMQVPLAPLFKRLEAWLASFAVDDLLASSTVAADHAHLVRRA